MAVDIAKVGQVSAERYVNSCSVIRVIVKQGELIGRLHETIQNVTKHINILSATICGTGKDLRSYRKEMEYYAAKLHQVEKRMR